MVTVSIVCNIDIPTAYVPAMLARMIFSSTFISHMFNFRKVPGEILAMGAVGACVYRICMEQENVWILGGGIAIGILFLFISRVTGEKLGYGDSLAILILGIYMGIWKLLLVLSGAFTFFTIGAVLVLSSRKMSRKCTLPFFPFLTAGYLLYLVTGPL